MLCRERQLLGYGVKRQPLILLAVQARGKAGFSHILFQSVYNTGDLIIDSYILAIYHWYAYSCLDILPASLFKRFRCSTSIIIFIQAILKGAMYQKILPSELIVLVLVGTVNHCFMASPPQQLLGGLLEKTFDFCPFNRKRHVTGPYCLTYMPQHTVNFVPLFFCCFYVNINGWYLSTVFSK